MATVRSRIVGCGSYLPKTILTNAQLSERMETSDEWIQKRTGITQRHIAAEGELTSDLAVAAAQDALSHAGLVPGDIDLIIVATTTPDETFPATATTVQRKLGINHGFAFDVQAVCAGFVYALSVGDSMLRAGHGKRALVIGAETFTRILDWEDRGTAVLFGDGSGAVVLEAIEGTGTGADQGILSTHLHSDGREHDILYVDGGPSSNGQVGQVRMAGKEVYKHAVTKLSAVVDEALAANGLETVDWLVPHQANRRIIDAMGERLKLDPSKVVVTVDRHANTSAASIPLALAEAVRDGRINEGDLVLMEGIGGGLAWGAALVRF